MVAAVRQDFAQRPPAYLGDAVTAAGFRLAGVDARSPQPEQLLATFRELLTETGLLLLGVDAARSLPAREVRQAVTSGRTLVVIVPDIRGHVPVRDLRRRLKRELGVDL